MKKIGKVFAFIFLLIVSMAIITGCSKSSELKKVQQEVTEITLYKSPMCGCCGLYNQYLDNKFNAPVKLVEMQDITPIKQKYGIPLDLQSCHTTVINGYFIEGHMPEEAIIKLLTEKPAIKGIALPGMPSGSPGMPGNKQGAFVVYAVNNDGTTAEFMRI